MIFWLFFCVTSLSWPIFHVSFNLSSFMMQDNKFWNVIISTTTSMTFFLHIDNDDDNNNNKKFGRPRRQPTPWWPWPFLAIWHTYTESWRQAGQFEVLHDMVQTESIFDLDLGDLDLWPSSLTWSTRKCPKTHIFFTLTSSRSIWGITRYGIDRINFWPWPWWPWPLT